MKKTTKLQGTLGARMAESIAGSPSSAAPCSTPAPGVKFRGRAADHTSALIDLDRIQPDPNQPRKTFAPDEIDQLADSLRTHGQLQPIVVRWHNQTQTYWIIAGERRYRAAKQAGLPKLRCHIVDESGLMEGLTIRELQVVENAVRVDVPPVEQAKAYRELMAGRKWSARELAKRIGVRDSTVVRALQLLDCGEELQAAVDAGDVPASAAIETRRITDPERRKATERVIAAEKPTRERAKQIVAEAVGDPPSATKPKPPSLGRAAQSAAVLTTQLTLGISERRINNASTWSFTLFEGAIEGAAGRVVLDQLEQWITQERRRLRAGRRAGAA